MLVVNPGQETDGDPQRARSVTIRDVAQRAGVSHQTVSRYLRFGGAGVREQYRELITAAVAELDYRPNLAARAMRTRRTGRLAVLLPDGVAHSSVEVLEGATRSARAAGFGVDVVAVGGEPDERRRRALELIDSGLFEGVLALTPLGLAAGANRPPVVEFPLYDQAVHGIGQLADAAPVEDLVEHLAALGHRRFLHLAGSYEHESARRRRDAYVAAVTRLGLEDHGVVECHWDPGMARRAVRHLRDDAGVSAVVAANDPLALGAVRGALERGWRVPQDLSVTGFDTTVDAAWMSPSLTSVRIDHAELGRRAIARLIAALRSQPVPADGDTVMSIVLRESSGPR